MRFFIVSNEIPAATGVVVGRPSESRAVAVARELNPIAFTLPEIRDPALRRRERTFVGSMQGFEDALTKAFQQGARESSILDGTSIGIGGALVSANPSALPSHALAFERRCITAMATGHTQSPVPAKVQLFCGAFGSEEQLRAILAAEGGNSRIHIFNRDVARGLFKRHGGGILEDGAYLLHPKRDNVLVPFRTFHTDMLQEMTREVRVVMGRIGARKLVVETVEGVTFSGSVVSRVPLKSGGVEVEAKENAERRMTYEWGSPTFEPERALEDCVWIRDNAGAMTIVDQRRTSDLVRFEEFSNVDTSFRVGLELMKLFEAKFAWASTSTYRYAVDFFPRR